MYIVETPNPFPALPDSVSVVPVSTAKGPMLAKLKLSESPSNIRQFGAKGNGLANDSLAVQRAINFVKNRGGGDLIVPSGNYRLGGRVLLENVKICVF